MTRKLAKITEAVCGSPSKVDREAGVISGVKILGKESKNGREYTDAAMEEAARLYEGAKVNIDHRRENPKAERGFLEGFGELRNVTRKSDGVFGDLHFLKSHPAADAVCESAERFPNQFGLSHDADGEVANRDGKWIVESVKQVHSVDVVGRPATNAGIFESIDQTKVNPKERSMKKITIRKLIESKGTALQKKRLQEMDDEAPVMDYEAEVATEETGGGDADDQIWAAFRQAIMAAVDDDNLDLKATLSKVKDILAAYGKIEGDTASNGGGGDDAGDGAGDDEEPTEVAESIKVLTRKLKLMESRDTARALLEEHSIPASESRIKLLAAANAADRKSLLEEFKSASAASASSLTHRGSGGVTRPAVSAPLRESASDEPVKYPADNKAFSRSILR